MCCLCPVSPRQATAVICICIWRRDKTGQPNASECCSIMLVIDGTVVVVVPSAETSFFMGYMRTLASFPPFSQMDRRGANFVLSIFACVHHYYCFIGTLVCPPLCALVCCFLAPPLATLDSLMILLFDLVCWDCCSVFIIL